MNWWKAKIEEIRKKKLGLLKFEVSGRFIPSKLEEGLTLKRKNKEILEGYIYCELAKGKYTKKSRTVLTLCWDLSII